MKQFLGLEMPKQVRHDCLLLALLLSLSACGVQRPLVRPSEIPAKAQEETQQQAAPR